MAKICYYNNWKKKSKRKVKEKKKRCIWHFIWGKGIDIESASNVGYGALKFLKTLSIHQFEYIYVCVAQWRKSITYSKFKYASFSIFFQENYESIYIEQNLKYLLLV